MRAEAVVTIKENCDRALQAITTYLKLFALTPEVALVRLDGQYGDTVAIAQLIKAGVYLLTRARGYRVLEHRSVPARTGSPTNSICDESEQR
jgi:stage III sporulation protein SpoIIIAA